MRIFSWYGLTIRTKVVVIQQKYDTLTRVNYRADKKTIYTQMMQKIDIMSILRKCKKNNIMSKILV